MAESETRTAITQIAEADSHAERNLEAAQQLETVAQELRVQAPRMVDTAIGRAVGQLMADAETGSLSPRDTLEAVLDINQFKPSRVIWSGPPDSPKILGAYDRLVEPGVPHIFPPIAGRYDLYTGLTGDVAPSVRVVAERGMGGLPGVEITFGSHEVSGEPADPQVAEEETQKVVGLRDMKMAAVGEVAIQEYIDSLRIDSHESTCGCGQHHYRDNLADLTAALKAAQLLAKAGGFSLDTASIEEKLEQSRSAHDYERHRNQVSSQYTNYSRNARARRRYLRKY